MSQILDILARECYSQSSGDEEQEVGFKFHVLQHLWFKASVLQADAAQPGA